jgi:hypothetical protein
MNSHESSLKSHGQRSSSWYSAKTLATFRQVSPAMVQQIKTTRNYVKEALQRTPNVLILGPFQKVSQRLTESVLSQAPMSVSGAEQRHSGKR